MNSRVEGLVKYFDEVGGKEHDAGEVFYLAQENGNQRVTLEVIGGALFEEDVSFVKEDDSAECLSDFEDAAECFFDGSW